MSAHTGNAVASTVSVAGVAPPGVDDDACKKLDEKNKEERAQVADQLESEPSLNKEEQKTLNKTLGGGMTISSALRQVGGSSQTMSASSSGCAQSYNPSGLSEGGTSEQKCGCSSDIRNSTDRSAEDQKKMDNAGTLCDKKYVHPGGGKGAHAEAKIANDLSNASSMRGGSMLLNIDWRSNKNGAVSHSGMPCASCYHMLCHAATECDIEIFICDKDQNPQPLSKEDCKSDDGYSNLSTRVDGNPTPGR